MNEESYYIDEFQDYLERKSELNKLVQHNKIIAPNIVAQRCFSRFESEEHIAGIQNFGGKNIVVVADYFGQRVGDPDDKKLQITVDILFGTKKQDGTLDETDAINEAVKIAEKIMFQFWNQMENDFERGCNALENLQPEKVTWHKIDDQPWLDGYYGWLLSIPFGSYMPEYNENDWEEDV